MISVAKLGSLPTLEHLEKIFSKVQAAGTVAQEGMKICLQSYTKTLMARVEKAPKCVTCMLEVTPPHWGQCWRKPFGVCWPGLPSFLVKCIEMSPVLVKIDPCSQGPIWISDRCGKYRYNFISNLALNAAVVVLFMSTFQYLLMKWNRMCSGGSKVSSRDMYP